MGKKSSHDSSITESAANLAQLGTMGLSVYCDYGI